MKYRSSLAARLVVLFTTLVLTGCNGHVREESIEIRPVVDPLFDIKSILTRYERGEPLGSEAASFESIVAEVKKTDPEKSQILDQGLKRILQLAPSQRVEASSELLRKISVVSR